MIVNHIELSRDGEAKVLITWHLPRPEGHFYPLAFQFAEDVDDELRRRILEVAKRPLKIPEKQHKLATAGSSDHFGALVRPLARLGFRTRTFGAAQHRHVLEDRPIEEP